MINRKNWKLNKEFLRYRKEVDQVNENSLATEETHLRYLLKWADSNPFYKSPDIRPTFPEYIKTKASEGHGKPFSEVYVKKVLATSRNFFTWVSESKQGYRGLLPWIKTVKTKRMAEMPKNREYVTIDEILKIASAPCVDVMECRTRAMAVFLFLSGMRIDAFVSLPLLALNIKSGSVLQYPSLGVRTKNRKSAKTFLLPINELLLVVLEWDQEVRKVLPENGYWFAPLDPRTKQIDRNNLICPPSRKSVATRNLKEWLGRNGLQYHSPHKFRHGHVHYGQERSITQEDYKAVSMNVMHANVGITDTYYSNLPEDDLQKKIFGLTKDQETKKDDYQEYKEFMEFKRWKEQFK
ncbi:MAG: hypothetical protein K8R40_01030 [Anaerolineaceae bacterium]|nr:hypothetical protein [Anaerolineaceae bacterium]